MVTLPKQTWEVESVHDQAHKEQIHDLATVGNLLYSTSMKCLRVWDLNNMQMVSDITAHNGVIKCVKTMPRTKTFVTAGDKNDKTLMLWDMTTL